MTRRRQPSWWKRCHRKKSAVPGLKFDEAIRMIRPELAAQLDKSKAEAEADNELCGLGVDGVVAAGTLWSLSPDLPS